MKEFKGSTKISFRWWRDDKKAIPETHLEALRESALERAGEMVSEGYIEGELADNIHMTDDDPEDGIEYSGWWTSKHTGKDC